MLALGDAAERASGGAFAARAATGSCSTRPASSRAGPSSAPPSRSRALPDTDFCLSAGGDITCRTVDPAAAPWRIGIEDPRDPTRLVAVVPVRTGAVATSGTAHRGAHIVDARTGRAARAASRR